MPTRPAVVGLLRWYVYLTNAYADSDVLTIWTYAAGVPSAARIAYERGAVIAWLNEQWLSSTNTRVSATRMVGWDFSVSPPVAVSRGIIFPAVVGAAFSSTGRYAPRSVVAVIALRTQPVGSPFRDRTNGRIAHGGLVTDPGHGQRVEGDLLTATSVTSLTAVYHNLRDRLKPAANPNSGTWVVPSWRTDRAPRAVPLMSPVNHVIVRPQVGTQRRRMPRQGPYARGA